MLGTLQEVRRVLLLAKLFEVQQSLVPEAIDDFKLSQFFWRGSYLLLLRCLFIGFLWLGLLVNVRLLALRALGTLLSTGLLWLACSGSL